MNPEVPCVACREQSRVIKSEPKSWFRFLFTDGNHRHTSPPGVPLRVSLLLFDLLYSRECDAAVLIADANILDLYLTTDRGYQSSSTNYGQTTAYLSSLPIHTASVTDHYWNDCQHFLALPRDTKPFGIAPSPLCR